MSEWKTSACILCECNCGIKVQLGGENDREIVSCAGSGGSLRITDSCTGFAPR